jgi:hypothetical protein
MLPFPPVIAWTLGALGTVLMTKLLAKEWRRVNAALHAHEQAAQPVRVVERGTLRRDPVTGVYRPD